MLENLSKTALRDIIKHYNAHVMIKNFYKKSKEELIEHIHKFMVFENGQLTLINEPYKFDVPQKKPRTKKKIEVEKEDQERENLAIRNGTLRAQLTKFKKELSTVKDVEKEKELITKIKDVINEIKIITNKLNTKKNDAYKFDTPQPKPIKMFSYDETEIDKIKNEIAKDDEEVKNIMENIRTFKPKEEPKRKKFYFPNKSYEDFQKIVKIVSRMRGGSPLHNGLIRIIMNRIQESINKKEQPFVYIDEMDNSIFKQVVKQIEDLMKKIN